MSASTAFQQTLAHTVAGDKLLPSQIRAAGAQMTAELERWAIETHEGREWARELVDNGRRYAGAEQLAVSADTTRAAREVLERHTQEINK